MRFGSHKLYFRVTREEQQRRFERRRTDPLRQWKLSELDSQAQDRWDKFTTMKYKVLKRTPNDAAPWTVIRSDDKHLARLNVMKVILNSVDYEGRDTVPDFARCRDCGFRRARSRDHEGTTRPERSISGLGTRPEIVSDLTNLPGALNGAQICHGQAGRFRTISAQAERRT